MKQNSSTRGEQISSYFLQKEGRLNNISNDMEITGTHASRNNKHKEFAELFICNYLTHSPQNKLLQQLGKPFYVHFSYLFQSFSILKIKIIQIQNLRGNQHAGYSKKL